MLSDLGYSCFNTANSKYCYLITFVFPSLRSGTRDVRTSSSRCSSAASHPSSHTVNGKYCCNWIKIKDSSLIKKSFNTVNGKYCYLITFVFPSLRSGTRDVRASSSLCSSAASHSSSHTINGKYYYNKKAKDKVKAKAENSFNTVNGKYCCNSKAGKPLYYDAKAFQYRKR